MTRIKRGLYDVLITDALERELLGLDRALTADRSKLHKAEAADRIAMHLARLIERAIDSVGEDSRIDTAITLARDVLHSVTKLIAQAEVSNDSPSPSGEVLRAILGRRLDGELETIQSPLISLLDTALLTNAPGEPRVGSQIKAEIQSADRIDVVMAFIRLSGIAPLLEALRAHCSDGRTLRVLTTTYTGSTEASALESLKSMGAEIRVSYDTESTRLHAKAWHFHRESGFSTAYIGSSNLTHSAQITGLEWNVRVSSARNRAVIEKVIAVFESYWNSGDFIAYERERFMHAIAKPEHRSGALLSPIELRAEPFQLRLLELIQLARSQGRHRNLLVSATGTGKTVMAALDYASLRETLPRARLLFVAHRREILEQSLATFRHALRDYAFGELWVGGETPSRFEHVFASIQSLNESALEHLHPEHFDVVIVDEFHHAAAQSYQRLLKHLVPKELLGLTATPERSDELSILEFFDGRIAAELRLWDAIDQQRLVPFVYFGVSDGVDLTAVKWERGGYQLYGKNGEKGLNELLTGNEVRARLVIAQLHKRVASFARMRALGFCATVEHARFMARMFNEAGIHSVAIWGDTPEHERADALRALAERRVNVVFSVDLFNEGVDVPAVDTLLMLRPTESPTLFLQQLGRGLRRSPRKSSCLVLDFVGNHRREFRFDRRFRALLGGSREEVRRQVSEGFPLLPAGCHMELDPVAREVVLASIKSAVPSNKSAKLQELRALAAGRDTVSLADFLLHSGLELEDIYSGNHCWSDLCEAAKLIIQPRGTHETELRRACGRMLHVDDVERCDMYAKLLRSEAVPTVSTLDLRSQRLLRMLIASLLDQAATKELSLQDGCRWLWEHPQVQTELLELLPLLKARAQHVTRKLVSRPAIPLSVHARYTRLEILAAFGVGEGATVAAWQDGVRYVQAEKTDLLAFTLDKTGTGFSPTTRYRDYAISRDLIHWESQSRTRADSETGTRYQKHVEQASMIALFARLNTQDRAFYFLGPASYVSHQSERPMAITWKLEHPLPGDLFAAFAAAVA